MFPTQRPLATPPGRRTTSMTATLTGGNRHDSGHRALFRRDHTRRQLAARHSFQASSSLLKPLFVFCRRSPDSGSGSMSNQYAQVSHASIRGLSCCLAPSLDEVTQLGRNHVDALAEPLSRKIARAGKSVGSRSADAEQLRRLGDGDEHRQARQGGVCQGTIADSSGAARPSRGSAVWRGEAVYGPRPDCDLHPVRVATAGTVADRLRLCTGRLTAEMHSLTGWRIRPAKRGDRHVRIWQQREQGRDGHLA
jgi:hypothetical protein